MVDKVFYRKISNDLMDYARFIERMDKPSQGSKILFIKDLRKADFSMTIDGLKKDSSASIYVISCENGLFPGECHKLYKTKREELKGEYAFARINDTPSKTMYVGSSNSIQTRIKQHLGYGAKKTYSLQLRHWITSLEGDIDITIYQFSEIEQQVLQLMEDALWNKLQPMFGKRGAR